MLEAALARLLTLKCYYRSDSSPTGDPCPQLILDGLVSSAANKVVVVHLYYGS